MSPLSLEDHHASYHTEDDELDDVFSEYEPSLIWSSNLDAMIVFRIVMRATNQQVILTIPTTAQILMKSTIVIKPTIAMKI